MLDDSVMKIGLELPNEFSTDNENIKMNKVKKNNFNFI